MELNDLLIGLILGIVGSYIASLLWDLNKKRRAINIRNKIEQLNIDEEYLERISKGNIALIRSNFQVTFAILGILCFSLALPVLSSAIKLPEAIHTIVQFIVGSALLAVGYSAFSQIATLKKLRNLPEAKKEIEQKRQTLREKLN